MNATATHSLLSAAWGATVAPASEPVPVAQLALPGIESAWRYRWHCVGAALANLIARRRLSPQQTGRYVAHFRCPDALTGRWQAFFEHSARREGDAPCTFLYAHSALRLVYARLFVDLGADARQLMHLRHQTWHPQGVAAYEAAHTQRMETRLKRAVRIAHDAVLLVIGTEISDGVGTIVARIEDSFVARHLDVADVVQAEDDAVLRRAIARLRRRTAEIDERDGVTRGARWTIDSRSLRGYAGIAGGREAFLGSRLGGWLFGSGRSQLQPGHLRNLVARELSRWGVAVERLSITFVGKAQAGQTLRLLQVHERFEVCDETGRLVAFGRV